MGVFALLQYLLLTVKIVSLLNEKHFPMKSWDIDLITEMDKADHFWIKWVNLIRSTGLNQNARWEAALIWGINLVFRGDKQQLNCVKTK